LHEFGLSGLVIDLLMMMSRDLNFTYNLYFPPDGKWGGIEANGEWNGVIKKLLDGVGVCTAQ
jgi:ionotropic glutamate receptor